MMSTQTREVKAVHVADLDNLLKTYGQLQDFVDGNLKCQICSDVVTLANVGSIKRADNKLALICNKTSCYSKIIKNIQR